MIQVAPILIRPESFAQFVAGYYLCGAFQQEHQGTERQIRKPDPQTMLAQLVNVQIDLERSEMYTLAGHVASILHQQVEGMPVYKHFPFK